MNPKDIEVRITADGSTTLYRKDINETYHSSHGALQEARHVFIEHGLAACQNKAPLKILEIGFGTGLNALLTELFSFEHQFAIEYHGLEALPLPEDLWCAVNYSEVITDERVEQVYKQLHQASWDEMVSLHSLFSLNKIHNSLQRYQAPNAYFDLIYFDAFGPRAQEEMWHRDLLEKLFHALKPGGMLTTYCAKGSFKRDLKSIGFEVESLPGPPGKREMTRAKKSAIL